MPSPPLLTLRDIQLTFGGPALLTAAHMMVYPGERLCLVGHNGCGKSTLLKIAAGLVAPDGGERSIKPGNTVYYLEQDVPVGLGQRVGAFVRAGLTHGGDQHRAQVLLGELDLDETQELKHLSGGEMRRAALVKALAKDPDILLLDEPTNHLDLPTIEWLEDKLHRAKAALVVISHDRRFLQNVTSRTIWLDRGRTRPFEAGFEGFEGWRDEQLEHEELEHHKLERKIVREEHWLTYGVTARRKRNMRRLKDLYSLRQSRAERVKVNGGVKLEAQGAASSGKTVIEIKNASKKLGEKILINDFSIRINKADRVGIAGPNGAGKTTLVKMIIGTLAPDKGSVKLGTRLEITNLDQRRDTIPPQTRLMDALTGGRTDMVRVGGMQKHVMSYMKDFLFAPEQARTPIGALSGGERARVALAVALAAPSNLLILDEPTNDLDLETLDLLQEMIADYDGTVLLVSHDRDFLDKTVTSLLMPDMVGGWVEYPGGYSDMQRQLGAAHCHLGGAKKQVHPDIPKNIKESSPDNLFIRSSSGKNKMTYKDKYALEKLPEEISILEEKIKSLKNDLAAPDAFSKDPKRFNETARKLEHVKTTYEAAQEHWLELEILRESLE